MRPAFLFYGGTRGRNMQRLKDSGGRGSVYKWVVEGEETVQLMEPKGGT